MDTDYVLGALFYRVDWNQILFLISDNNGKSVYLITLFYFISTL